MVDCPYGRLYECDGGCYECPPHGSKYRQKKQDRSDCEADRIWDEMKEEQAYEQFNAADR